MFRYRAPSDKFRACQAAVSALLFCLFLDLFVVIPVQAWIYEKEHPWPGWALCTPNGMAPIGDDRHFIVWSATSYSPDRRYVLIYNHPCAAAAWGSTVEMVDTTKPISPFWDPRVENPEIVFQSQYPGMVIPIWVTNRLVRVTCWGCSAKDAAEAKRPAKQVTVEYKFVAAAPSRP